MLFSRLAAIRRGRSLWAKISGGRGRPCGIFFGFYKTRPILVSDSANCIVLRAIVLTQYRRVTDGRTDGQTDGIAVASTALAMRRAVKSKTKKWVVNRQKHRVRNSTHILRRAFHAAGPAWEKALSLHFVRSCGIAKFVVEEDRRPVRERLRSTGLTMLDR